MKLHWEVSNDQLSHINQLQDVLDVETIDELVAQAVWLLEWVVKHKQKGMTLVAVSEEGHLSQRLEMPGVERIAVDVESVSASQFPHLAAGQVRNMVENGQIEEAIDAAEVVKRFEGSSIKHETKQPNETERVKSAMTLEAAKIMADEGAPATAITLIQEVGTQKKIPTKKRKKRE
jgi:hypothetical protein